MWKPIETAPKDIGAILTCEVRDMPYKTVAHTAQASIFVPESTAEIKGSCGWCGLLKGEYIFPTHWMDLPHGFSLEACAAVSQGELVAAVANANAVAAERQQWRWRSLRDQIQADVDRPKGRWGIHGRSAVDDDYFAALEWVIERMDETLRSIQASTTNPHPEGSRT